MSLNYYYTIFQEMYKINSQNKFINIHIMNNFIITYKF